jgi:cytochrome c553
MPIDKETSSPASKRSFTSQAVMVIGATAVLAWGLSLIVIPALNAGEDGFWGSLCRSVGIPVVTANGKPVGGMSAVVLNKEALTSLAAADPAKGAALAADYCASCHDANGTSSDPATIPSITGQSARAIYKQLWDMKNGARINETMKPLVDGLDDAQIRDVAAYYSTLPRRNRNVADWPEVSAASADLVTRGSAARALPPCAACHDAHTGGPVEAPLLAGQYPAYVEGQLRRYAAGERKNDLFARMRTIAAKLSDTEMKELARYYDTPIASGFNPKP